MQQGKALLHVAQAEALLELGNVGALAVIGEQQVDGAALGANGDLEVLGVAVAPCVRHAFLHDAVEHLFLVGAQALGPLENLEVDLHAGRAREFLHHVRDGLPQRQVLEVVGPQLLDAAAHILEAAQGRLLYFDELFIGLVGGEVDEQRGGVEPRGDAGQRVAERVMDLAREAVALARLGHRLRFDRVGAQARRRVFASSSWALRLAMRCFSWWFWRMSSVR